MKFPSNHNQYVKLLSLLGLLLALSGCFGSSSTESNSDTNTNDNTNTNNNTNNTPSVNYDTSTSISTAALPTVKISGSISGLSGTVILQNNLSDDLTVNRNGNFTFFKRHFSTAYSIYSVTVKQHPSGQSCLVSNSTGNTNISISNIVVTCSGTAATIPSVNIARVEVAQIFSQTSQSTYQRLVPGRHTLVRAFIYASSGNVGSATPTVTVTATSGGVLQGIAAMTCPATLAQTPTTLSTSYARSDTCYVELDGLWINPNLSLKISAGASDLTITPDMISVPRKLDVVIVPIVVNNATPSIPSLLTIKQTLYKKLPFPYDQVGVTIRAAYRPISTKTALSTFWWEDVIDEINNLRLTENPGVTKFYYGMLPYTSISGGYIGLGYTNNTASEFYPTAMGYNGDNSHDWARVMVHELSHNLSSLHAPCANGVTISQIDPNYPGWSSGSGTDPASNFTKLGTTPIYEQIVNSLFNPVAASHTDIMGYCSGQWLSEYQLYKQTTFLRTNGVAKLLSSALSFMQNPNPGKQIRLTGRIYSDRVVLQPIEEFSELSPNYSSKKTDNALRLILQDGSFSEYPLQPVALGDYVDGSVYFSILLDKPNVKIAAIEVTNAAVGKIPVLSALDPTQRLDQVSATREKLSNNQLQAAVAEADAQLVISEQTASTLITWNHIAYPWLKATLVNANGERKLMKYRVTGGQLSLPSNLENGGYWEIALSDGLNTNLQKVAR